jgi:hypothetical protein
MTERTSSWLILVGGVLVVLLLWYLSYLFVRRDTARRGMTPLRRKMWTAAAAGLPLFGFALYLFDQILKGYLSPPDPAAGEEPGRVTDVRRPADMPPARGVPATGGAASYDHPGQTPSTVPAFHQMVSGRFLLKVTQGPHTGLEQRVDALPMIVGRGPEAGLALENDLNVSRAHAEIYEWAGSLRIRDIGSTHGTQVNGVPVNDQALNTGDRISVGGTTILLREKS